MDKDAAPYYSRLQPDQDQCLALLAEVRCGGHGGAKARERLVVTFEGLVRAVVARFVKYSDPRFEDYLQEAFIALLTAIDRYDPDRGTSFSTFCWHYIRWMLQNSLSSDQLVRLPGELQKRASSIAKSAERLRQRLGREPTVSEIAAENGERTGKISLLLRHRVVRDEPVSDETGAPSMLSLMVDAEALMPDEAAEQDQLGLLVRKALAKLPDKKRDVISRLFGIGCDEETGAEIGRSVGLTRQGVRKVATSSLPKLRLELSPGFG